MRLRVYLAYRLIVGLAYDANLRLSGSQFRHHIFSPNKNPW